MTKFEPRYPACECCEDRPRCEAEPPEPGDCLYDDTSYDKHGRPYSRRLTMIPDERIKEWARVLAAHEFGAPDLYGKPVWDCLDEPWRQQFIGEVRALMAHMEATGTVVRATGTKTFGIECEVPEDGDYLVLRVEKR